MTHSCTRASRLHPDLNAFVNCSRCYFELKRPASNTSTTLGSYPYRCTTVLEIQTNTSNMSNTSFPPQIGNYLLGQQLGSGVSGMFDFDRHVDLAMEANSPTLVVDYRIDVSCHAHIHGPSGRSQSPGD